MKLLLCASLALLWQSSLAAFTNPINPHGPDPWMLYYEGYYYLAASTFASSIVMRKSKTLGGISSAKDEVVFALPSGTDHCCHMWAPEFHLLNSTNGERWYMYFTAGSNAADYVGTQRIHVLESAGKDPMGPYTYKASFRDTSDDSSFELDASILNVNNKLYLMGTYLRGRQDLFIRPLSNPWTASGKKVQLSQPTATWETQGGAVNEGPEALYHGGKTMIVFSASYCQGADYKLGLLTLTGSDPLSASSWTKSANPVFQKDEAAKVYGPGHNGFFKSPDGKEDWIVYHANSAANGGCDMNRSTRAQKFTFNSDGTPNFGKPVATGTSIESPSGE